MKLFAKRQPTMMKKKFFSMLLGGTLAMMAVSVMLMSDSLIAGAVIGPDAVAGVTLVTPLYSFAAFFASLISLGVPILYTTEMGKFRKKQADHAFGTGLLLSVIVGILMFVLTTLFGEMYFNANSPSAEILAHAKGYLSWIRFTIMVLPVQMLMNAVVYSDGDEKVSTVANVVQGVGNIAFSIIFSRFMGIRGIGLASFIFNMVSFAILMIHFVKKTNTLRLNLYFSFKILKEIVHYSIIDSSSYLFLAVLSAVLNAFISAEFGPEYLILSSAITLIREFLFLFEGIGEASGPIFSVYVGEENHNGLRSTYALGEKIAVIEGIVLTVILVIIAPLIPQFLNVADPKLVGLVTACVRISALGSTFISLLYLITAYYLVIRRIVLGLIASALRDLVLNVGLAVLFGKIFGLYGMFIGLAVAPAISYALLRIYLVVRYGKEDAPLLLSKVPGNEQSYLYNLSTEPQQIIDTQQKIETVLKEHNVDEMTVGRVSLLIEEMYVFIRQMNNNKPVLAECTMFMRPEGVQIISKDDGVPFDMSDEDISTVSLSAYTVASYIEKRDLSHRHLVTLSFNRSSFLVRYPKE